MLSPKFKSSPKLCEPRAQFNSALIVERKESVKYDKIIQ